VNDLTSLIDDIEPSSTVLFLGAGSSLTSGAPSVDTIKEALSQAFHQISTGFSLAELTQIIERKTNDRRRMVSIIRALFTNIVPTGGLRSIALYDWKAIYTTNFDELVEHAYAITNAQLVTYSSNFDFSVRGKILATRLFKLHGTLCKDISDGYAARLILTESDYANTEDYREHLYDTFRADLSEAHLVIIGHSLSDPDIKSVVERANTLHRKAQSAGRITLLMHTADDDRAALYESRGLRVVVGGIDDFFRLLAQRVPIQTTLSIEHAGPLAKYPALTITSVDVLEAMEWPSDVSRMYNGWPATFSDVRTGLTFHRSIGDAVQGFFRNPESLCATILGAGGVGKTTAARQLLVHYASSGTKCWEHKGDHTLDVGAWRQVAHDLAASGERGLLFVDDAHAHVLELGNLVDDLVADKSDAFKILIASGRNSWQPRAKSPNIFKHGKEFVLSRLDSEEIESLLALVERNHDIRQLVEASFAGFSPQERRRRLVERCEADMFVCMKNIFASESFDDIVLREFAELEEAYQHIYRFVAALETIGVRVHRQLVIRLLRLKAQDISKILAGLADIVTEYTVDRREHIYGWRGRHQVISSIITKYKFHDLETMVQLFDDVIDNIVPTYDIEVRSIQELCNIDSGIARFSDVGVQNRLLRKLISVAPGERVPRHRLIRNLIKSEKFEQAQTEIRIFEKDFRTDGPVARYSIELMTARATRTPGIMVQDRLAILDQARNLAKSSIERFQFSVRIFSAYCEVGLQIFKLSGKVDVYDDAISILKDAETRIADPAITQMIKTFDRRFSNEIAEDRKTVE